MYKSLSALSQSFGQLSLRQFSTTTSKQGAKAVKFVKAQKRKQLNQAKQLKLNNSLDKVDPVFGRNNNPFIQRIEAEVKETNVLTHGYQMDQVDRLLHGAESARKEGLLEISDALKAEPTAEELANKREAILRILNMRNGSSQDSMKLAIKLAREEFQRFDGDTGSSEVQAAIMTVRIHNLAKHVKENKNDNMNTRVLRTLVQQRQSILRYLKRDNPERYFWTLHKLGLSDASVVNEFNMDRRYMQDYKFFGDRILVKDSKKVASQKRKELRKQKRISK